MTPTVAVIASGAMGAGVGGRLTENGVTVLTMLKGRSEASQKRAAQAKMRDATAAEIAAADIVLSIIPPGQAEALARELAPALTAAAKKPVYADCNALNPETKKLVGDIIAATGCAYVDAGIVGPPPKPGSDHTRFYVSGPHSAAIMALNAHGLSVRDLGGAIGNAAALKMCYGAFNKGLTALGSALALAAGRHGVADAFHAELALSQAAMLNQLNRTVPDMFPQAYRFVAEFDEVAEFVAGRPEQEMFRGIARLYEALAADIAGPGEEKAALARFYAPPAVKS
jgi:3-hydroxyisobutyrate dehydrogenase-like beta-hydroxyacid dehydrogenase